MSSAEPEGATEALPDLEELWEPVAASELPPLTPESFFTVGDKCLQIRALLREEGPMRLYRAVRPDGLLLWVREAGDPRSVAHLQREAEVLQSLESPMFPRVVAAGEAEGRSFLALEGAAGPSLAELLAQGQPPLRQVLSVLAQAAFALGHLHARGWAHLALRPAALVLDRPVRILELGQAARLGEPPANTFHYAGYSAPELAQGEPVDAAADIYGLGALLYHAVAGNPLPETGWDPSLWNPPRPVAGVPQVLHCCLGRRETRYANMAELHRELLRLARAHTPLLQHRTGARTTVGLEPTRTVNQDACATLTWTRHSEEGSADWTAACVADGMGGMAAGEIAAAAAVQTVMAAAGTLAAKGALDAAEQAQVVRSWVQAANERVTTTLQGMGVRGGCTLACALLVEDRLAVAHVGDCRIYRFTRDQWEALTRDHSLVMALVLQGEVKLEDLRSHPDRSSVTRSLGERHPLPDYFIDGLDAVTGQAVLELDPGDTVLLCSDGLWEPAVEAELARIVAEFGADPPLAAQELLRAALAHGAPDNATAVLVRVEEASPA